MSKEAKNSDFMISNSPIRGTKRNFQESERYNFVSEDFVEKECFPEGEQGLDLDAVDQELLEFTNNDEVFTDDVGAEQPLDIAPRLPILLYISCNDDVMTPYQCLIRKQIEFFQAFPQDIESNAQGRNRPVVLGQVGIRCIHCNLTGQKTRGAVLYPSKLLGVYQAAQNMATMHLMQHCQAIPAEVKASLLELKEKHSRSSEVGKDAWAKIAEAMGIFEDAYGLRFTKMLGQGFIDSLNPRAFTSERQAL